MNPLDVIAREALSQRETPYGSVGDLHLGRELRAWWIWKDQEDLLYVVRGSLRLELEGREPVVLRTGETFVIPPHVAFRGYRWPRDGEPCLFLAVAPADATFS